MRNNLHGREAYEYGRRMRYHDRNLNGLTKTEETFVLDTMSNAPILSTSLPDCYITGSEIGILDDSAKWFTELSLATGITYDSLIKNIDKRVPASMMTGVCTAFAKFITQDQAEALQNWLTGGYQYKGWFGLTKRAYDARDFLDAEHCYGYYNPTLNISDCLIALRNKNLAAQDWAIHAAVALGLNKSTYEDIQYNKILQKELDVTVKVAAKTADTVADLAIAAAKAAKDAADGVVKTVGVLGWLASNIAWIAPVAAIGVGAIVWHNREKIAKVAKIVV